MSDAAVEVLVVGAGVAGLTAALFASRLGRATHVLSPEVAGGCLISIEAIEDFPGLVEPIPGFELCPRLQEQAEVGGATFSTAAMTGLSSADDGGWLVATDEGDLTAATIVVASGTAPIHLGVDGEERLGGRGVTHCASCDGPLYRDRRVAVAGNGDAALSEALTFSRHGAQVSLLVGDRAIIGQDVYRRRVMEDPAITVTLGVSVHQVLGNEALSGLVIAEDGGGRHEVAVDGLLVSLGRTPVTDFLGTIVELDDSGRVVVDAGMRASVAGIFAAGDVRALSPGLAIAASGDGAVAAASADRYLTESRP